MKAYICLSVLFLAFGSAYPQTAEATGFPDVNRLWAAADYQDALNAIRGLSIDQYPSKANPTSSSVIHRLTNLDNLAPFLDRTAPLDQRLLPCVDLIDAAKAITEMYAVAKRRNPGVADDYLLLLGFLLHGVVAELSLLDEFVPTLDPQDSSYATRMKGLEKMKSGINQMLTGSVLILRDRTNFSSNARAQFAVSFASTFPTMAAQLPTQTKTRLEGTIRRIAANETNTAVKSELAKLGAVL